MIHWRLSMWRRMKPKNQCTKSTHHLWVSLYRFPLAATNLMTLDLKTRSFSCLFRSSRQGENRQRDVARRIHQEIIHSGR